MRIDLRRTIQSLKLFGIAWLVLLFQPCLAQKNVEYYESGKKKYQEELKDGEYVGKRTWWYESGQKQQENYYDAGALWRRKKWNERGELISDDNLKKKQKNAGRNYLAQIPWQYDGKIGFHFLNTGTGEPPEKGDQVALHYIGYLNNGKEFDNSVVTDEPLLFTIGSQQLLPAFERAISAFRKGQKGYIKIPSELGYGEQPVGAIPPNAALNYYIEILDIRK